MFIRTLITNQTHIESSDTLLEFKRKGDENFGRRITNLLNNFLTKLNLISSQSSQVNIQEEHPTSRRIENEEMDKKTTNFLTYLPSKSL